MSSILTNSSALSALQALQQTQQEMAQTENQVSTGLAVATAKDNASYWSIATQLTSDNGVVTAANSALTESQSVLDTASSAISSIITTINSIENALTEAAQPGADIGNINTTLATYGQQLTDAVNGASFNGLNLLNGSQVAALNFVAGFNATTTGGSFNTISFTAQALTGAAGAATTAQEAPITDAQTINNLINLADNTATVTTPSYGVDQITNGGATANTITVASKSLSGVTTTTTYSILDANGNAATEAQYAAAGGLTSGYTLAVSQQTTTPGGLLTSGAVNLTTLTTTATTAATQLTGVEAALTAVTNYAALIGATQDRMTSASTFNSSLETNYAEGVSGLVDANMNTASTRLQALQTQEQLGIQSLSIANQNSQLLLKLFSNA
ncbi:MAG: flagellin [Roseiarcus sp.]|jgi:flagellin